MKPLGIWLGIAVVVFGVFATGYHLVRQSNPVRVFVVVDTSYEMDAVSRHLSRVLDEIDDQQYAEFALATDKGSEHSWASALELSPMSYYGPRDLSRINGYPEIAEASKLILVTTADASETAGFADWEIVRIEP